MPTLYDGVNRKATDRGNHYRALPRQKRKFPTESHMWLGSKSTNWNPWSARHGFGYRWYA